MIFPFLMPFAKGCEAHVDEWFTKDYVPKKENRFLGTYVHLIHAVNRGEDEEEGITKLVTFLRRQYCMDRFELMYHLKIPETVRTVTKWYRNQLDVNRRAERKGVYIDYPFEKRYKEAVRTVQQWYRRRNHRANRLVRTTNGVSSCRSGDCLTLPQQPHASVLLLKENDTRELLQQQEEERTKVNKTPPQLQPEVIINETTRRKRARLATTIQNQQSTAAAAAAAADHDACSQHQSEETQQQSAGSPQFGGGGTTVMEPSAGTMSTTTKDAAADASSDVGFAGVGEVAHVGFAGDTTATGVASVVGVTTTGVGFGETMDLSNPMMLEEPHIEEEESPVEIDVLEDGCLIHEPHIEYHNKNNIRSRRRRRPQAYHQIYIKVPPPLLSPNNRSKNVDRKTVVPHQQLSPIVVSTETKSIFFIDSDEEEDNDNCA